MFYVILCEMFIFAFFLFILVYYFGEGLYDLKKAKKHFKIPGIKEGFVPQGLCYEKVSGQFLISGYLKKKPSRVYVVNATSGEEVKYVCFKDKKGKLLFGHFGGIVTFGAMAYISSDGKIYGFLLSNLSSAVNGGSVEIELEFKTENGADFCFVQGGMLFSGEFYKFKKYETDITHHMLIDGQEQFHAVCLGFKLSNIRGKGEIDVEPEVALAVPDLAQGLEVFDDKIFISTSYGISKSRLLVFENVLKQTEKHQFVAENKKIPLFVLGSRQLLKTLYMPAMSEGVSIVDGRIYILFENSAKKYFYLTRTKIKNIFSLEMNKI